MSRSFVGKTFNSLVEVVYEFVQDYPDFVIYRDITEKEERIHTYTSLHRRAKEIAFHLKDTVQKGDRVILLFHNSLSFVEAFFGTLYAGGIPVPTYPPLNATSAERLAHIFKDSGSKCIMTYTPLYQKIQELYVEQDYNIYNVDEIHHAHPPDPEIAITEDDIAFIQYTSGSTGEPKGVLITHANVIYNLRKIQLSTDPALTNIIALWMPNYHDMGLIGGILTSVCDIATLYIMKPIDFIRNPYSWLELISDKRCTASLAPNFAFNYCYEKISDEKVSTLDLSSASSIFNGAEPINKMVFDKFFAKFGKTGIRPQAINFCYGLAEATLLVTVVDYAHAVEFYNFDGQALAEGKVKIAQQPDQYVVTLANCGQTMLDTVVRIVHPETMESCAEDEVGEIWIKGPLVAQGYYNNPKETAKKFDQTIKDTGEKGFFRTGDLGFFVDNNLFVSGRIKDVIIVRGRNFYPHDIEFLVQDLHEGIKKENVVAFGIQHEESEEIAILAELNRPKKYVGQYEEIANIIRSKVARTIGVMPATIIFAESRSIPRTTSGKIKRNETKNLFLNDDIQIIYQFNPNQNKMSTKKSNLVLEGIQKWIVDELAKISGMKAEEIKTDVKFEHLGIDSLSMAELAEKIESKIDVELPVDLLWEHPTIESVAEAILDYQTKNT